MCVTIVGKIIEVNGKKGVAVVDGMPREMELGLVKVRKGDFVSCALGIAVEKLGKKEAMQIIEARKGLSEAK